MTDDDVRPVAKSIPGSADFWEPVQRHAAVLGNAVISWCELQEELGLLFGEVVAHEGDAAVARAAWHEVRSDRTQRHMLRAAIKASFPLAAKPLVKKHLLKALGKIDNMENSRNDAVHAPIQFVLESSGLVVIPMDDSGNPRAEALKGKDLEVEFRRYRENTDALRSFIKQLRFLARDREVTADQLPEMPQILSYEQAIARWRGSMPPPPAPLPRSSGE